MKVEINNTIHEIEPIGAEIKPGSDRIFIKTEQGLKSALAVKRGNSTFISFNGKTYEAKKPGTNFGQGQVGGSGNVRATMPGQIVEVSVATGDTVEVGQKVAVLEAMKMQQPLTAAISGIVTEVKIEVGVQVDDGQTLVVIEPNE